MYHLTLFINHFIIIYSSSTLYFKYILQLSTPICNINLWYYHVLMSFCGNRAVISCVKKNIRTYINTHWPDLFSDIWLAHDVTSKVCETDVTDFVGDNRCEAFVAQSTE